MTILETERLLFRQHDLGDLEAFCAMEAEPEVRQYVGGRPRSRAEAERRFREGALRPARDKLAMWATVYKPEQRYIGRCGLYPHITSDGEMVPGEATLAFYLAREYWGRGLATEAARAFVKFGFEDLDLTRIVATVQAGNDASVRVLKKLGFVLTRTEEGIRSFLHYELEPRSLLTSFPDPKSLPR